MQGFIIERVSNVFYYYHFKRRYELKFAQFDKEKTKEECENAFKTENELLKKQNEKLIKKNKLLLDRINGVQTNNKGNNKEDNNENPEGEGDDESNKNEEDATEKEIEEVKKHLDEIGVAYRDFGTNTPESCDYPIYGEAVAKAIMNGEADKGILIGRDKGAVHTVHPLDGKLHRAAAVEHTSLRVNM